MHLPLFRLTLACCLAPVLAHAAEEVSVPLERIHLCCEDCVEGVQRAVTSAGAGVDADQGNSSVVIYAPDTATAQKAVNAMVAAGFYGISKNPAIKVAAVTGAKDTKVKGTDIEGLHLCCRSCVESVKDAVTSVAGVTALTATTNATSIQVKGEFNEKAVVDALLDAGFSGKVSGRTTDK